MTEGLVPACVGWSFPATLHEYANSGFIDSWLSSRQQSGLHLGISRLTVKSTPESTVLTEAFTNFDGDFNLVFFNSWRLVKYFIFRTVATLFINMNFQFKGGVLWCNISWFNQWNISIFFSHYNQLLWQQVTEWLPGTGTSGEGSSRDLSA